eukprot:GHRR01000783.1.p1 GENE.GHRR01000783.1~~GHRR01000783.1.p1  ORF type:complete len:230 (+),score=48.75 GHRR01000783.1:140-829(+)
MRVGVVWALLCVLAVAAPAVGKRHLLQNATATTYPTLANAIIAANTTPSANLTDLIDLVEDLQLAPYLNATTAWTILAPTNKAWKYLDSVVSNLTGMNATSNSSTGTAALDEGGLRLEPTTPLGRQVATRFLEYHVLPGGGYRIANFTDGMTLPTLLADAPPLTVHMNGDQVIFEGAGSNATLMVPDIVAGLSVIHVVDPVLMPPLAMLRPGASLPGTEASPLPVPAEP